MNYENWRENTYREWTKANYNQRAVDESYALSWTLESLRFLSYHLDIVDHLRWGGLSDYRSGECSNCKDFADGNHFD